KERSLATGIFNSGSNVGVIVAALAVPWLTAGYGWRAAFILTGSLGFLWVVPWLLWFRKPAEHRWLSKAELTYIQSDGPAEKEQKVPTSTILGYGAAWAFIVGKFV